MTGPNVRPPAPNENPASVSEVSFPNNLSEEAKLLLNSTVKVNIDQAAAIESSTREQSENVD